MQTYYGCGWLRPEEHYHEFKPRDTTSLRLVSKTGRDDSRTPAAQLKTSRLLLKIWRVIKLASLTCLTTGQK